MAKLVQVLVLDPPDELHFRGPFDEVTTTYLKLTNPTDQNICFKLKTTAPKTYCVRPNTGIILPKKTINITVMLQPIDSETADRNRHKFMVQSVFAPDVDSESPDFDTVWRDTPPDRFMNSKMKCVFDPPASIPLPRHVESVAADKEAIQEKDNALDVFGDGQESLAEMNRLENENNRLRQMLNELRMENSSLKEEGLRLRVSGSASRTPEVPASTRAHPASSAQECESTMRNVRNIVVMIIVLILGIVIGAYQGTNNEIDGLPDDPQPMI